MQPAVKDVPDAARAQLPPPSDWQYRIEGAQKIVFSYKGPSSLFSSQILWLHVNHTPTPPPASLTIVSDNPQPLQTLFADNLADYIYPATPHTAPPPFLAQLALHAEPHRPLARRLAKSIPTHSSTIVHTEHDAATIFGPHTILVEIKPKDASLSRSRLVPPAVTTPLRKFTTPTYHIKNYLIPPATPPSSDRTYHPAQLLSGQQHDMLHALNVLRRERARGFRVFRAGVCLLAPPCVTRAPIAPPPPLPEHYLRAAARALHCDGRCVAAVASIQTYDYLDNIGAARVLKHLHALVGECEARDLIAKYLYSRDCREGDGHVDELRRAREMLSYTSSEEAERLHDVQRCDEAISALKEISADVAANLLADFMQAAVAKDCSILVSLCPVSKVSCDTSCSDRWDTVSVDGQMWYYALQVVDIEVKDVDKILKKWAPTDWQRAAKLGAVNGSCI